MKDENTTILVNTKIRILQYLEYKGISKPQFYTDIEIKRGLLDSDKMNSTVTDTVIAKILVTYKDIAPMWLLTGEGPMLRNNKTSEESKLGGAPNATPISPAEESIIYKMYKDEKEEKERLVKEKESKIDHLQSELRALTAELAAMKAQHSQSQNKESDHHTKISEVIENFTSDSSGDYGEGYPLTKKPTSSKKLSAGKM